MSTYLQKTGLELIIPILISFLIVILSLNNNSLNKLYQKQYILLIYFISIIFNIYFFENKAITFKFIFGKYIPVSIFIFFILFFLGGINLIYQADSDELIKKLSPFKSLLLKSFEWFFTIKSYIIYKNILISLFILSFVNESTFIANTLKYTLISLTIFLLIELVLRYKSTKRKSFLKELIVEIVFSKFSRNITLKISISFFVVYVIGKAQNFYDPNINLYFILSLLFIIISSFSSLINNAQDLFGTLSFVKSKDLFEDYVSKFNNKYMSNDSKKNKLKNPEVANLLGFLVYMEDKDFIERKKLSLSTTIILKRKYAAYKLRTENTNEIKRESPLEIFKINKLKRGFSTLPQQLIRNISLKSGSYPKNLLRRKLFVEKIYMNYFFEAYISSKEKIAKSSQNYSSFINYNKEIAKVDILKAYYHHILNCPDTKEALFKAMAKQSKYIDSASYDIYYNKYFMQSDSKIKYIEFINENMN